MSQHALYRFFAADGALLYVGISNDPSRRWQRHSEDKPWWLEVTRIDVEPHPSREAVLEAEGRAIRSEGPRYNIRRRGGSTASTVSRSPERPSMPRTLEAGAAVALGLRSGECPVGIIDAIDDDFITIALVSFLSGCVLNRSVVVRRDDIERVVIAGDGDPEDAFLAPADCPVFDMDPLGRFQTEWKSRAS